MPTTPLGIEYPVTTDPVTLAHYYERLAVTADDAIDTVADTLAAAVAAQGTYWQQSRAADSSPATAQNVWMQAATVTVPVVAGQRFLVFAAPFVYNAAATVANMRGRINVAGSPVGGEKKWSSAATQFTSAAWPTVFDAGSDNAGLSISVEALNEHGSMNAIAGSHILVLRLL